MEIEGDSKIIIEIVQGIMKEGWVIKRAIEDIRHLLLILKRLELKNIFREGNRVANEMVALGLSVHGLRCCKDFRVLPNLVRILVNNAIIPC